MHDDVVEYTWDSDGRSRRRGGRAPGAAAYDGDSVDYLGKWIYNGHPEDGSCPPQPTPRAGRDTAKQAGHHAGEAGYTAEFSESSTASAAEGVSQDAPVAY